MDYWLRGEDKGAVDGEAVRGMIDEGRENVRELLFDAIYHQYASGNDCGKGTFTILELVKDPSRKKWARIYMDRFSNRKVKAMYKNKELRGSVIKSVYGVNVNLVENLEHYLKEFYSEFVDFYLSKRFPNFLDYLKEMGIEFEVEDIY